MEQGIIYRSSGSLFNYIGWPTVAKDENGVIYAVCSGHRLGHICPFGMNYMFKSYDGGKSFDGPIIVNDTPFDDRDAGILPLGNNKLLLSWFINDSNVYTSRYSRITNYTAPENAELWKNGVERWKQIPEEEVLFGSYIRLSENGGKSWSEPINVPVTSPHGPAKLKDGRLLYLGTVFGNAESNTNLISKIAAYESLDDGYSWNFLGTVPNIENVFEICEPYQLELDNNTILGVIRVHGEKDSSKFSTYKTFSYDGGKNWSNPELVCKGAPPHLLLHSSGAIVMTYTIRDEKFGQRARISRDGGKSFSEEIVLCENAKNWDSGYCSSIELDDGSIYTVYYQKAEGDNYCSLMYTKWNLPK